MIRRLLTYSGISTKVHGMHRKLLKEPVYRELASMTSVQEAVEVLKRQESYADMLSALRVGSYHRGEVEKLLTQTLLNDFHNLYLFAGGPQRKYLELYFVRYEIEILKKCLRTVFNNKKITTDLSAYGENFERHSVLSIQKLSEAKSLDELIRSLSGTPYEALFKKIEPMAAPSLFDYEITLDIYYLLMMWKGIRKYFTKNDLKILFHEYGPTIDLMNLMWIARAKKYYKMDSGAILSFMIPVHYHIKRQDISALAQAPDYESFLTILSGTYYAKRYADLTEGKIEEIYLRVIGKVHRSLFLKNPYSMASILSYLYYKEQELNKLTTMLECIRYRVSPTQIMVYMNKLGGIPE